MRVGEIWKLNKNAFSESDIPDLIQLIYINGADPACKICGVMYPIRVLEGHNGVTKWGFSHERFLTLYQRDWSHTKIQETPKFS